MAKQLPSEVRWLSHVFQCYNEQPLAADIGGGRGDKTLYMALSGAYVVLLDVNLYPGFRDLLKVHGESIDIIISDAHSLPLRDGAFDAALLWNVLMFLSEDRRAVQEASRILRDYGVALISVYSVQSGNYNYSWNGIARMLSIPFLILYSENHGSKQVKFTAIKKPSRKRYITLKVDARKLVQALNQVGIRFPTTVAKPSGEALVLIPRSVKDRSSKWRGNGRLIHRINLVSFAIISEMMRMGTFDRILGSLSEKLGKQCIHSSDEIYKALIELKLNKIYAEKFANDLMRLGVLAHSAGTPLISSPCHYLPSFKVAGYLRYTPYVVGCNVIERKCLAELLIRYNPIMRGALAVLSRYTDVSIEAFRNTLKRELAAYLNQCYGKRNSSREHSMLDNTSYLFNRVLEPLERLSIIKWDKKTRRIQVLVQTMIT
jgi:ubiquinone/menaquinone biosynthesis C-methylase UbiE